MLIPERRLESLAPNLNLGSIVSRFLDCGSLLLLAYGSSLSPIGVRGLMGGVETPALFSAGGADGLGSLEREVEDSLPLGPSAKPLPLFSRASSALDSCESVVGRVEPWSAVEGLEVSMVVEDSSPAADANAFGRGVTSAASSTDLA